MGHVLNGPDPHFSVSVVGAGALGLFYGAKLAAAGHRVVFQTRSGAAALARRPLVAASVWGDFSRRITVVADPADLPPADLVLVTVKALPSLDYRALLGAAVIPGSVILLLQNGINTDERIARLFPRHPVLAGLAFTCINRTAPARLVHSAYGRIRLGSLVASAAPHARALAAAFVAAGIPCDYGGATRRLRWEKLLWNIPFNGLSVALGGVLTDRLVGEPDSLALVLSLMDEVRAVAKADGFPLTKAQAAQMVENTRNMTPYRTSMLVDFEAGREMEVAAIYGEPLAVARRRKVAAPTLGALYRVLSFLNAGRSAARRMPT